MSALSFSMQLKFLYPGLLLFSAFSLAEDAAFHDRIEITAQIPDYQQSVSKVLPQQQVVDETSFSSDSLASLLSHAPAVNLNGQGGLFQTINIRGFARWRIQTLIEGIPIYTERRAGTSVEFIPPGFIGQAYLTQGAASTQLGSGAIGGGLDLHLTIPQQTELELGYGHNQEYRNALLQGNTELTPEKNLSWKVNHRHANNSEDGSGNAIQDRFEHNSLALRFQDANSLIRESLFIYSASNNIAKASADLPQERITLYPENRHMLGKMTFDWHNAAIYFHDSQLHTQVTRPGNRTNATQNDALSFGIQLNDHLNLEGWHIHWRAALDTRTGVKAFEREVDNSGQTAFARYNLDASQWEASLAADFSRDSYKGETFGGTWIGGARLAHQYQNDKLSDESQNDTNISAFIGFGHQFQKHWQWSVYVSNAYRVPGLTERYFNGSTPRGTTLGDPNLKTETAINVESSLSYEKDDLSASISIFQQKIDDYIERLTINDELRQYRNLVSAKISGINYQLQFEFDAWQWHWKANLGGQWLSGEDQDNNPIADISPAQHRLTLTAFGDETQSFVTITHRQSSDELVSGELPTSSVTTFDAGFSQQLNDKTQIALNFSNLTDKTYVTSRDDLAPQARGRDIHLSITWVL